MAEQTSTTKPVQGGHRLPTKQLPKSKRQCLKIDGLQFGNCAKRFRRSAKPQLTKILTEHLGYSKVCARWVPKMLTADHKRQRVEAAQEFLAFHGTTEEEFLDSIVTGDETWVHYTTPETKEQSKQWKHPSSPRAKKFKQILSAGKIMASIFWDRKGVLLCEFMPRGTTINADRYCET
ncbi:histone-lysine N-methyltransferase SETMAR [Trichonephila clavipes]|nr:histone-lysine N-methyltransferase SETMAR [Trichonephila clavipes]